MSWLGTHPVLVKLLDDNDGEVTWQQLTEWIAGVKARAGKPDTALNDACQQLLNLRAVGKGKFRDVLATRLEQISREFGAARVAASRVASVQVTPRSPDDSAVSSTDGKKAPPVVAGGPVAPSGAVGPKFCVWRARLENIESVEARQKSKAGNVWGGCAAAVAVYGNGDGDGDGIGSGSGLGL